MRALFKKGKKLTQRQAAARHRRAGEKVPVVRGRPDTAKAGNNAQNLPGVWDV